MMKSERYAIEVALHDIRQAKVAGNSTQANFLFDAIVNEQVHKKADFSVLEMILFTAFFMGDMKAANKVMEVRDHGCGLVNLKTSHIPPGPQHVLWTHDAGFNQFEFHADLFNLPQLMIYTIHTRWVAWLKMISAYTGLGGKSGCSLIDVGDWSHGMGMVFCDNRPGAFLVPDSSFLSTNGYQDTLQAFLSAPVAWAERHQIALWRGGSTGISSAGAMELPRVHLCRIARETAPESLIDAGLTEAVQVSPAEASAFREADFMRERIPSSQFHKFKYQIDIDGNTNSWPGLMQKLLTGSPVLKISSTGNYRQWYYDRLIPWHNYVPVRADMADLPAIIRYLRNNDELAREIGSAGLALGQSLTVRNEAVRSLPIIEAAFADHNFRYSNRQS